MPNEFCIQQIDHPNDNVREAVLQSLRSHNEEANPVFWERRERPENRSSPLNVFALNPNGAVVGGLFAETQFSWLRIHLMATRTEWRGQGIGRSLLKKAELIARTRDCKYAYVDTMDYQAPGFYEKAGYRIAGTLDDWDSHGHRKLFFVKEITNENG